MLYFNYAKEMVQWQQNTQKKNYRQDAPTGIGLNQLTLNNLTMQLQSGIQHNTAT